MAALCHDLRNEVADARSTLATACVTALSAPAAEPVSEHSLAKANADFSTEKHKLIDLQTKRSLASALASSEPFAALDANSATEERLTDIQRQVKDTKAAVDRQRRSLTVAAEALGPMLCTLAQDRRRLEGALERAEELLDSKVDLSEVRLARDGVDVVIDSEETARRIVSENTMIIAELRATTMQQSIETVRMSDATASVQHEIAQLEENLARLEREREVKAYAARTEAGKAEEAAEYYDLMRATLQTMVRT